MIPNIGGPELIIMPLTWVAPLIIFFFIVKWAVASGMKNARSSKGLESSSARETLDERYARGEIGREEYERMRRDIEN